MTEQELREKIKNIVHNELLHEDIKPFGDGTYAKVASKIASALIAEGLTFDKTIAILSDRSNRKTLILKAQYYDEMKHRAEVAEKALNSACFILAKNYYTEGKEDWAKRGAECATFYREQAERELAEEGKDD